ncbi:MAG: acetolactate decarboxylase [bacterium]
MKITFSQRNTLVVLLFFPIAALLLYGSDLSQRVFYQYGVISQDNEVRTSSISLLKVKRKGSMILGMTEDRKQQLLGVNGLFYLLDSNGLVTEAPLLSQVSFAYAVRFHSDATQHIDERFTYSDFELYLLDNLGLERMYAVQLTGDFMSLDLAYVSGLGGSSFFSVSEQQLFQHYDDISGCLFGFVLPSFMSNFFFEDTYVFYFISDDRQVAGRVLDFVLVQGDVSVDLKTKFTLDIPKS